MSYDKAKLEQKAITAIKRNKIKFISHLNAFLPCARSTFYELELDKSDTIKEAIEINREGAKAKALNRWEKSKNPTLEVAFYKLIADDDEAARLNGSKQTLDIGNKGGEPFKTTTILIQGVAGTDKPNDSTGDDPAN